MPTKPYLRDYQAEAIRLLAEAGQWVVAGVETNIGWPTTAQVVEYQEKDLILRPGTHELVPSIVFNSATYRLPTEQAREIVLSFASALSWMEQEKLEITMWMGGNRPFGIGRGKMTMSSNFLDQSMLPQKADELTQTALAFYREGLSTANPFYSFLSFFKTISVIHKVGNERSAWMQGALLKLDLPAAKERYAELQANLAGEVGKYLYDEGRSAIAHAELKTFVHPDRLIDHERIFKDLPLIRNLADLAIQEGCGLLRSWGQHHAKDVLGGFIELIGDDAAKAISSSEFKEGDNIEIPDSVTIVARRPPEAYPFEGFRIASLMLDDGKLLLECANPDDTIVFQFVLDFANNQFEFDPLRQFHRVLDRDSYSGILREIQCQNFLWCLLRNGSIEIWDDKSDRLLAKSEGVFLTNMMLDVDGHTQNMKSLEALKAKLEPAVV